MVKKFILKTWNSTNTGRFPIQYIIFFYTYHIVYQIFANYYGIRLASTQLFRLTACSGYHSDQWIPITKGHEYVKHYHIMG